MKHLLLACLVLGSFSASAFEVQTTSQCMKTEDFVKKLREYEERPLLLGRSDTSKNNNVATTIWVSKSGTYTISITFLDKGHTCVLDTGDNFKPFNPGKTI